MAESPISAPLSEAEVGEKIEFLNDKVFPELFEKEFGKLGGERYTKTVDAADHMRIHAVLDPNNKRKSKILGDRRPNEAEYAQKYRETNFRQVTFSAYGKVKNTLHRIFNPRLFHIEYPDTPGVFKENTVENYFTKDYPEWDSFEQQFKQIHFDTSLWDSNGIAFINPIPNAALSGEEDELISPFARSVKSADLIAYMRSKWYIIFNGNISRRTKNGKGKSFYYIDRQSILLIEQEGDLNDKRFFTSVYYQHELGITPVVHYAGENTEIDGVKFNQSFISPVTPHWDEALCIKSDQQAVRVRAAFPKEWKFQIKCYTCKGSGQEVQMSGIGPGSGKNQTPTACKDCNGKGYQPSQGPFDVITIDPEKMNNIDAIKGPPGGYFDAPTGIIEIIGKEIDHEIDRGFGSINMDHLIKSENIAESGVSRAFGRTDLNTFMQRVADEMYPIWQKCLNIMTAMRYGPAIPKVEELFPIITPPTKFDLETSDEIINHISTAKQAGVSGATIQRMELDLIQRQYSSDSVEAQMMATVIAIDPLPNITAGELMAIIDSSREIDRYVHVNISRLISMAMNDNRDFLSLPMAERARLVYEIAEKEIAENKADMIPPEESADNG